MTDKVSDPIINNVTDGTNYNNKTLKCQVCIIGSGPAGITVAWELQRAGIDVILLEGGRDYRKAGDFGLEMSWAEKKLLYGGKVGGLLSDNKIEPDFLIRPYHEQQGDPRERERYFGGTSSLGSHNYWAQCRPADPVDFVKRLGSPGWPISREDLDPYYAQASVLCKLQGNYPENFTAEYWAGRLKAKVPALDRFDVMPYQSVPQEFRNFATRQFDDGNNKTSNITQYEKIRIILNATLLDIVHDKCDVTHLRVGSMADVGSPPPKFATEFTIEADAYVLACGSVANARQLLLSEVGNEQKLVGHYFMCHPFAISGGVIKTNDYLTNEESALMNGVGGDGISCRFIPNSLYTLANDIGRCWFWYYPGNSYYFEMTPNYDSLVSLLPDTEKIFGQRLTMIDWQLGSNDEETFDRTMELYTTAVKKRGGTVSYQDSWAQAKAKLVINGHHIGTTRMASDPKDGVVDANLKVHSLSNLFVAGASVFPSALISNPTFTIIALSIRLAEHLRSKLGYL